jgi:hypothetical protein
MVLFCVFTAMYVCMHVCVCMHACMCGRICFQELHMMMMHVPEMDNVPMAYMCIHAYMYANAWIDDGVHAYACVSKIAHADHVCMCAHGMDAFAWHMRVHVCMHACMHVYVCMCVHVVMMHVPEMHMFRWHTCACMHMLGSMMVCMRMHVCVCVWMYVYVHAWIDSCCSCVIVGMYVCVHACVCMYVCVCVCLE